MRACFTLLRHAAGQLKVVFAEAGAVDFIEVAQIALSVLKADDGLPPKPRFAVADGIRHLLVDEFQDTSRRQHELLRRLIAAWPEREGRTCFVVGDPMQSIYFFRDADAELFPRVKAVGLEIPNADPLLFDPSPSPPTSAPRRPLVKQLNEVFTQVFAADDGSGVDIFLRRARSRATHPIRANTSSYTSTLSPQVSHVKSTGPDAVRREGSRTTQPRSRRIVALIQQPHDRDGKGSSERRRKYRIAVLGRAPKVRLRPSPRPSAKRRFPSALSISKNSLTRPEVLDALPWPAPCSIPSTALPGWVFCALPGADLRSPTCTSSPVPTMRSC